MFVWIVQRWNTNQNLDEIDMIESNCYLTEERANLELELMKREYPRQEWALEQWRIGKLNWQDGFERIS